MQEGLTLSPRESYTPSGFMRFLWWLSTADERLLKDCAVDRSRYAIVGSSVMGTWLFATLAWMYFFSTVVNNPIAFVLLGLFMGAMILSIDRALIKGINQSNKNKWMPLIFRGILAITIGVFMAQPALLYLFDKEVHVQISLDNEQRKKDKRLQEDALYGNVKADLLKKKTALQQQLDNRYKEVSAAREAFIAETDGTGGSKKTGMATIAKAKKASYDKLDADYQLLSNQLKPQIQNADSTLAAIEKTIQQEQKGFDTLMNDGFLTRIEALNHLVQSNTALQFRYYLLVAILLLIELMPVITKILSPSGSYEKKLMLLEAMEATILDDTFKKEEALHLRENEKAFTEL